MDQLSTPCEVLPPPLRVRVVSWRRPLILGQGIFSLSGLPLLYRFSFDSTLRVSIGSHLNISAPALCGGFDSSWLCAPPSVVLATLLLCSSKVGPAVGRRGSVAHAAAVKSEHHDAEEDDENDDADNDWRFPWIVRMGAVVSPCKRACVWHVDGRS